MLINIFKDKKLKIQLPTFVDSRALICANSGGGKSYAIRKILEESNNKIMSIVLDVEGEFRTLREKFDFLLIGNEGDVELNMKAAKLLPKKIMELEVSTIVDISDLKRNERIRYVKEFLEALMELPRKGGYWKPCLVILDEAHLLAGQQEKQDSCSAVIDLMTRGRKRGYCGVLCTQRISKLHKDAVAEANNILIGRTGLDIDMKRAAEILGFTNKKDMLSLRDLDAGEFYVFGTAISKHVTKAFVSHVKTTHPQVGMDLRKEIIKPTNKVIKILSKLKELPQVAEKELRDLNDYKRKVITLERELRSLRHSGSNQIDNKTLIKLRQQNKDEIDKAYREAYQRAVRDSKSVIENLNTVLSSYVNASDQIKTILHKLKPPRISLTIRESKILPKSPRASYVNVSAPKTLVRERSTIADANISDELKLSPAYSRLLKACAMFHPNAITKAKMAFLSNVPIRASTFRNGLSKLKSIGLIEKKGEDYLITQAGLDIVGNVEQLPGSVAELIEMWKKRLSPAYQRIFIAISDAHPHSISKEEISEVSEVPIEASTFRNGLSKLRSLGLIRSIDGNNVIVSEELMEI